MPPPSSADATSPFLALLLRLEQFLRTNRAFAASVTLGGVLVVAGLHLWHPSNLAIAMTYSSLIALATYGLGVLPGLVTGFVLSALWFIDVAPIGVSPEEVGGMFVVRCLNAVAIVALTAIARRAAQTRERHVEALAELSRVRADMVAAFSHDLRNPLTTIIGYSSLLRDAAVAGQAADVQMLDRILVNAAHLDHLIADMLAGGTTEVPEPLQLATFAVDAVVAQLRPELDAPRGPVQLTWKIADNVPPFATDRTKLVSVIRNLTGNALKFCPAGEVCVAIGFEPGDGRHRIEVRDTGPGIAPEALPHIFERRYRAAAAGGTDGFGIGLYAVKRFVDLMGGEIDVDSELGKGSRFVVRIPRLADGEPRSAPALTEPA